MHDLQPKKIGVEAKIFDKSQLLNQIKDVAVKLENVKPPIESTSSTLQVIETRVLETEFSGHGLSKVIKASNLAQRSIWIFVILSLYIICILDLNKIFSSFSNYEVISNIKIRDYDRVTLPSFVICTWESDINIDEYIFDCRFEGVPCRLELIEKISIIGSGESAKHNCIRLNSIRNNKSTQLWTITDPDIFIKGLSLSVLVPDKNVEVYYASFDNSISGHSGEINNLAQQGYVHFVTLTKTVLDRLPMPYNECTETVDNDMAKQLAVRGSAYTQSLCFRLCRLLWVEKQCNCSLEYQLWSNGNDTCESGCVSEAIKLFEVIKTCGSICPTQCDSVQIDFQIEKMLLKDLLHFRKIYLDILKTENNLKKFGNYSPEFVLDMLRVINVNFKRKQVTEINEIPFTSWVEFVSELGGSIGKFNDLLTCYKFVKVNFLFDLFQGLFMGFSLISIFEIFEFIFRALWITYKRKILPALVC